MDQGGLVERIGHLNSMIGSFHKKGKLLTEKNEAAFKKISEIW